MENGTTGNRGNPAADGEAAARRENAELEAYRLLLAATRRAERFAFEMTGHGRLARKEREEAADLLELCRRGLEITDALNRLDEALGYAARCSEGR
jgi:hypothetical protein